MRISRARAVTWSKLLRVKRHSVNGVVIFVLGALPLDKSPPHVGLHALGQAHNFTPLSVYRKLTLSLGQTGEDSNGGVLVILPLSEHIERADLSLEQPTLRVICGGDAVGFVSASRPLIREAGPEAGLVDVELVRLAVIPELHPLARLHDAVIHCAASPRRV